MQIEKESHMVGIMNGGGYPRGWKLMDEEGPSGQGQAPAFDMERTRLLHQHQLGENQCTSALVKHINAPLDIAYNINADTTAGEITAVVGPEKLILLTDVAGILEDRNDPSSLIKEIDISGIQKMTEEGKVAGDMIPKAGLEPEFEHRGS